MRRFRTLVTAGLAAGLVLIAGACGGDDDDPIPQTGNRPTTTTTAAAGSDEAAFPVTIDAANGPVEIAAQPEAIVSLSPTATEMLYAIGAGEQVKAVDDESDFPEDTPITELSGFETNVEAVAAEEPDLVLMQSDNNDAFAGFTQLGIPVIELPPATTLDDTYAQLDQLGQATGHVAEATEVADGMRADIEEITANLGTRSEPVTVYHEIDSTYYSASSASFIGQLYELAGLTNIADSAGADDTSGYPQLSAEFVVQQDPNWIFLAYPPEGDDPVAFVSGRAGWNQLSAVREGNVVALDPDIASRWGPRTVDLLRLILDSVGGAESPGDSAESTTTTEAA